MPITAPYTWNDKKSTVKVSIPLRGVPVSKVDIVVSESTLKVNFSPYLLDLVLFSNVDSIKHKASVKDGTLNITLYKKAQSVWPALEAQGEEDEIAAVKKEALAAQESLNSSLSTQRHDRRIADEKLALRKQMKLEEMERTRVDNLKAEEKEAAEKEVYAAFAEIQAKEKDLSKPNTTVKSLPSTTKKSVSFSNGDQIDIALNADDIEDDIDMNDTGTIPVHTAKRTIDSHKEIFTAETIETIDEDRWTGPPSEQNNYAQSENSNQELNKEEEEDNEVVEEEEDGFIVVEEEEVEMRYVPPPRSAGLSESADSKVNIQFTPRVFPTPMRESKAAEEEDWVAKNRRHLKKHGVLKNNVTKGNGVDVSEEDPVWLKAKGDDFFRGGDVRSALNAYSAAIDCDESFLACYSNRSACYLKLGMLSEARLDCNAAIDLILNEQCKTSGTVEELSTGADSGTNENTVKKDSIGSNSGMLVKLYMRRGAANCQLGLFEEALSDYQQANTKYQQLSASQLNSLSSTGITVESLTVDVKRLKLLNDAELLKREADNLFASRDVSGACKKYSQALSLVPVHVGCLSNRAACHMTQQDLQACVDDCTAAIMLLRSDGDGRIHRHDDGGNLSSYGETLSTNTLLTANKTMLQTILPPIGSEKRTSWTIKTLLRRGVAFSQLPNRLDDAVSDYATAAGLDPTNETLKSDLNKIMIFRESKRKQNENNEFVEHNTSTPE